MAKTSATKMFVYLVGIFLIYQNGMTHAWTVQWEYAKTDCKSDDCPLNVFMDGDAMVNMTISDLDAPNTKNLTIHLASDLDILTVPSEISVHSIGNKQWNGSFIVHATFLGKASVHIEIESQTQTGNELNVVITRTKRFIDYLFVISVASLVSILYINFGAAMDLRKINGIFRRPVGPAIASTCHFVALPLASYVLGLLLFPNNHNMRLGLFFTGASPAGGASNTWTVLFGGNLDLSITMSTISTLLSFLLTPLWLFTLGKVIFDSAEIKVPYDQIAESVFGLIVPLIIGFLIQRYMPRLARFLVRILKPASSLLIVFIVVFAIVTNLYLFKLFTWQILVAGLLLPWFGYFVGWLLSVLFRQNYEDRLAIAIEAGIQNTGIAIFVLRYALPQPEADLTTVMPVSVAIFTPFPLIAFYICLTVREWLQKRRSNQFPAEIKECIQSQESSGVY